MPPREHNLAAVQVQCGVVRAFARAMMLNKTAARTRVSFVCKAGVQQLDDGEQRADVDMAR